MADNPSRDDLHNRFLSPLIIGMTALGLGEALLEAVTRGAMRSPDALQEMYLTLMGGYVAGIEVQKWTQKDPWDPSYDPWVERAYRSGWIMLIWWALFIVIHLWRFWDSSVPMPASLQPIIMGI